MATTPEATDPSRTSAVALNVSIIVDSKGQKMRLTRANVSIHPTFSSLFFVLRALMNAFYGERSRMKERKGEEKK